MSNAKFTDYMKRLAGALAVCTVEVVTTPKDVAYALKRAVSKMPKGIKDKLNAERLIIEELAKDAPDAYKRAKFNSIADYQHALGELVASARLQITNLHDLASKLEGEVASAPQSERAAKDIKLSFGEGLEFSTKDLTASFLSDQSLQILQGENTMAEGIILTLANKGVEITTDHEHYGVLARAFKRAVMSKFPAPKAAKDPNAPKRERAKKAPSTETKAAKPAK